jgi:hypothetical protein
MPEDGGSIEVRLSLVEERVRVMEGCVQELRIAIASMNAKLTAILVSVTTSAILLAINVILSRMGAK